MLCLCVTQVNNDYIITKRPFGDGFWLRFRERKFALFFKHELPPPDCKLALCTSVMQKKAYLDPCLEGTSNYLKGVQKWFQLVAAC